MKQIKVKGTTVLETKEEEVFLSLSSLLYPEQKVFATIDKFSQYADLEFFREGERLEITIVPHKKTDLEQAGWKFMNYLLAEMEKIG